MLYPWNGLTDLNRILTQGRGEMAQILSKMTIRQVTVWPPSRKNPGLLFPQDYRPLSMNIKQLLKLECIAFQHISILLL